MTPIPAKVLAVEKQSSQYRVRVQIELNKYLGSFFQVETYPAEERFRFFFKLNFAKSSNVPRISCCKQSGAGGTAAIDLMRPDPMLPPE